ncbi:MAG TPA: hypothetical protein VFT41_06740 [Gemmatimonadaceae bacterium]|nr:hypothetical protein [Gemmatimonadaceae bacterium]
MPRMHFGPNGALTDVAERRMANQIARVHRGTFGATMGMRIVATSVARQMLVAGLSSDAVTRTLARCVLAHPNPTGTNPAKASRRLVALTTECVARAVREERAGRHSARSG